MTNCALAVIEPALPTLPVEVVEPAYYATVPEIAVRTGLNPSSVRLMIKERRVFARTREDGRGYEVNVATLPVKHRVFFAVQLAQVSGARASAKPLHAATEGEQSDLAPRFSTASAASRRRAEFRYEAVQSLRRARAEKRPDVTLAEVERRWLYNFRRAHQDGKVSIRSVKAWDALLRSANGNIDALVDRNDGVAQRGARIPAKAKQMFRDQYLREHEPNLALIYQNVVKVAKVKGWGEMPSYHTFWRYANKEIPKLVRKLLRDKANTPRAVLPHVQRDPTTLRAYHTIQSDIRQLDVPVRCDKGCEVCTGNKPKGHFPYWSAFFDIRSRRLLGSEISIEVPTSTVILGVFRRICDENGLPWRVYIDNGANYKKAFGRGLRRMGRQEWDGPNEQLMQARFAALGIEIVYALPYNAQAKAIERMFLTFRRRFDEDFEAYRGTLGAKSEFARELYYRPSALPALSELAFLLQLTIDEYNSSVHGGRGMDGQTPDEVFYDPAVREPVRKPDMAFGQLFFDCVKGPRRVKSNGILIDGRTYRLVSLRKHLEYFGELVDVRINPDDVREAIVYDRRTGAHVCYARVEEEATYNSRDEITRQLIRRVFRDGRELMRMAKEHVAGAEERVAEYRRAKVAYLMQRLAEHRELRERKQRALVEASNVSVGSFASPAAPVSEELTAVLVAEILDEDERAPGATSGANLRLARYP